MQHTRFRVAVVLSRAVAPITVLWLVAGVCAQEGTFFARVLPASAAGVEGADSTFLPFGSTLPRRVQYAYDGSTVGYVAPVRIGAIRLRCDGTTPGGSAPGNYTLTLDVSTSRNAPGTLSTVFDDNHGADRLRAWTSPLTVPAPSVGGTPNEFSLRIPFARPWVWDPRQGPLLVDFGYGGGTPVFAGWDAVSGPGLGGLSALGQTNPTASGTLSVVPVLELEVLGHVVPDGLAAVGGTDGLPHPWGGTNGGAAEHRVLCLYEAAQLPFAGRRLITALAWRRYAGTAWPTRSSTVRVTMSTSGKLANAMDATFDANHGGDRSVVFDGIATHPAAPANADLADFPIVLELQHPFEYDPALGSLAIDVQVFDASGSQGFFDYLIGHAGVGRIANFQSATAAIATNLQPTVAPVMAIHSIEMPTAPATLANTTSPGGDSIAFPVGAPQSRTLLLVSAADAGIPDPIVVRHLRFRPGAGSTSIGPSTWIATIDLSSAATTPATISAAYDTNHGADRTRVFDGDFSLPLTTRATDDPRFLVQVELDQPFLWFPALAPYLAIDIAVHDRLGDLVFVEVFDAGVADGARVTAFDPFASTGAVSMQAPVVQLGGYGHNGTVDAYGIGCFGANGSPRTDTVGLPSVPNPDFGTTIDLALGNAPAVFFAGFAAVTVPLPGAPGCDVLHAAELGILGWTITDPSGHGFVPLPLADDLTLHDLEFRTQWIVLDPTANALGLVTSNALVMKAKFF